ncbi:hypothetical protein [Aurantiacibacter sediminis]|uniref:DUF456 domain-containing protein n=1 Tax=Aurantiacibacter sediminis TaxID=2793064 RepID=A0ABS0N1W0_9SPHN|nr:hypothetical protein [Aurantiacibacter sediminis]MBH5321295.1 hypothetical protein [Aurantiacibacter sediminis]
MIGKIIGAMVGARAAQNVRSIEGPGGAVLGALAVPIISRLRLPTLLALGAGGYLVKKFADKEKAATTPPPGTRTTSSV